MTALRDLELDVLTDYAAGRNLTDIAKDAGVHLDRVTGILTRRAGMDRARAKEIVEQVGASPLTATIPAKGAPKPAPVRKAPTPGKTYEPPEPGTKFSFASQTDPIAPMPALAEPVSPADPLDVGLDAVSERLRDLVTGLAQSIARAHRANDLRDRVGRLEKELAAARAELDACEKVGGV